MRVQFLLTMALLGAVPTAAQTPEWKPTRTSIAGVNGGEVADLNGDGRLDVVGRKRGKPEIAVYFGDGAGRFPATPSIRTPLAYEPAWVTLGDVNGDGRMDAGLASIDATNEYAQVLLGDGKGGFSALPRFAVSPRSEFYKPRFYLGDFNEDGKADLLIGNGRHQVLRILFGDGRGGFTGGSTITLDYVPHSFYLEVADLDGDRHLDLFFAGGADLERQRLLVKLGDGRGGFRTSQDVMVDLDQTPRTTLADLDADGDVDALLSHADKLDIYLNDGKGQFARSPLSPGRQPKPAFDILAVDLNGDGRKDIAVAGEDSVIVLLRSGAGFVPASGSPYPAGPGAYFVRSADLNGDGRPDIVSNAFGGDSLGLLLGD
jgi:hypothetical protein